MARLAAFRARHHAAAVDLELRLGLLDPQYVEASSLPRCVPVPSLNLEQMGRGQLERGVHLHEPLGKAVDRRAAELFLAVDLVRVRVRVRVWVRVRARVRVRCGVRVTTTKRRCFEA